MKNTLTEEQKQSLFESLDSYRSRLINTAINIVKDRDEAEDVVQQSIEKAYMKIDSYDSSRPFMTWLQSIVQHTAIDRTRSAARRGTVYSLDAIYQSATGSGKTTSVSRDVKDKNLDIHKDFQKKEAIAVIMEAVESLPPDLKTAFTLYYGDSKFHEIAETTGLTIDKARQKVSAAKKILRQKCKHIDISAFF